MVDLMSLDPNRTLLAIADAEEAKLLSQLSRLRKEIESASDEQEVKLIEAKIDSLMRTVHEHVVPLVQALAQGPNAEQAFDRAYAVENLEKIVRLEAALDARIAKVLSRLVGLKEFKRTPAGGAPAMPSSPIRESGA
jgi:hypothetical protein